MPKEKDPYSVSSNAKFAQIKIGGLSLTRREAHVVAWALVSQLEGLEELFDVGPQLPKDIKASLVRVLRAMARDGVRRRTPPPTREEVFYIYYQTPEDPKKCGATGKVVRDSVFERWNWELFRWGEETRQIGGDEGFRTRSAALRAVRASAESFGLRPIQSRPVSLHVPGLPARRSRKGTERGKA
jgi:hypothetical protein